MNDTNRSGALDYRTFLVGMGLLTSNFPARGGTDASGDALLAAWWRVLEPLTGQWLTVDVFDDAVTETLRVQLDWLPTVGEFVDVCRVCKQELEREARPALPAPPPRVVDAEHPPPRIDRAWWDRNVAIGRARQRFKVREPSEAQVAAVLAEMVAARRLAPQQGAVGSRT